MLILASQSPRRRQLLQMAGLDFICIPADIEEVVPEGTPADEIPRLLALLKASAVLETHPDAVVIGSDTVVAIDGEVLGKPKDEEDALKMLKHLSGRTHVVHTGVAILSKDRRESFTSSTKVLFYDHTDEELRAYIATGDPMDKAGSYGIQGAGAFLVKSIEGDFYTVMGLPVAEVLRRLKAF
ncbi:MAG: septum formation inhibitor Maf [Lachnospiraceae bacterium]|nr:septum formation inhibitor Maf [Lachnospiraceae bacterium]